MRTFTIFLTIIFFFLALPSYLAAASPDAGQLLREQVPQRLPPQPPSEQEAVVERPALTDSGIRVTVTAIRFSGIEGLAEQEELFPLVQDAIGKTLGFGELQALADKVTAYLRGKGYFLARAYLPKQDVTTGVVEIAVIQGRLEGEVQVLRKARVRLREGVARDILRNALQGEGPLREDRLERAVLLINDLPGVTARAFLEKGTTPLTSRLTLQLDEGSLFSGGIWGDNNGNRYTGDLRGSGMVNLNDPFGFGDQFSLLFTGAEGLRQGRAGYSLPLGSQGLRASAGLTAMSYKVGKELSNLRASGSAWTASAGVSYPVVRRRTANLNATLGYEFKMLKDETLDTVIHDKRVHNGSAGLAGDLYDRHLGGGYTTAGITVTAGDLNLSRVAADLAADDAGPRANGQYARVNVNLSRLQHLMDQLALNVSYSGQLATTNLDSGEKFVLGGPNGVRAYPVGEASGDEGQLLSLELRYAIPAPQISAAWHVLGFIDAGAVTLHKTLWPGAVTNATGSNSYWLAGGGFGVSLNRPGLYALRAVYAHRIGDNPGRSVGGMNADGLDDQGRLWLQAAYYF